ncbi:MAG: glutamyl-tRNA reductase [Burkholderiales bacterium]|nr:glutamyl-tRNA reductase [Burkholderiales bacterium]
MNVIALGLNHHTAPLDLRGRLAFVPEQLCAALGSLRARLAPAAQASPRGAAPEAALLSTCNRTELYLVGDAVAAELVPPAIDWLVAQGGVDRAQLSAHTYVAQDSAAARHVFRVASGLDSMVLGEPQILGQMKRAAREAKAAGALGSTLHQLFQRSFTVAKEVRTRTEIGSHSVSMAAAAVRLAAQLFEDVATLNILFVGAGEMIELAATHFAARRPRSITLANRRVERAQALADRLGARTLALAELPQRLHDFDVVVSCTASALPLIGLGAVERALKARRRRPMLLVDLAVPRDIEPEVARLADAYLYTIDDLAALVQSAGERRRAAVEQAEAIVDAGVQGFAQWCEQRQSVPLIQALQHQADDWGRVEVQRALRRMAKGESLEATLQALASGLTHKMLHGTLHALHQADGAQREAAAQAVSRLFLRQPRGEAAG